jgi:hypothetical protein
MKRAVEWRCEAHPDPFDCTDNLIYYPPDSEQYGPIIHDGGSSFSRITYCPWCGARLLATAANDSDL